MVGQDIPTEMLTSCKVVPGLREKLFVQSVYEGEKMGPCKLP